MFSYSKRTFFSLLIAALLTACSTAQTTNSSKDLHIPDTERILTGGYTLAEIEQSILVAGKSRGWAMKKEGEGKIQATFNKAHKHQVVVDVIYTPNSYKIVYVSSVNLRKVTNDQGELTLHHTYHRWVQNLDKDIYKILLRQSL